jgi:hypothetical protein
MNGFDLYLEHSDSDYNNQDSQDNSSQSSLYSDDSDSDIDLNTIEFDKLHVLSKKLMFRHPTKPYAIIQVN